MIRNEWPLKSGCCVPGYVKHKRDVTSDSFKDFGTNSFYMDLFCIICTNKAKRTKKKSLTQYLS